LHILLNEKRKEKGKRGTENITRDIAIYLVRRLCCKTMPDVGKEFGINNYSTVSSVVQRVKRRIEKDRTLQEKLRIIEEKANLHLPGSCLCLQSLVTAQKNLV
jgi:putative transposase